MYKRTEHSKNKLPTLVTRYYKPYSCYWIFCFAYKTIMYANSFYWWNWCEYLKFITEYEQTEFCRSQSLMYRGMVQVRVHNMVQCISAHRAGGNVSRQDVLCQDNN